MTTAIDELAIELAKLKRMVAGLTTPQLEHSSITDGSLDEYQAVVDENGEILDEQITSTFGLQYDGTHGAYAVAGPVPPTPASPAAESVPTGVLVRYDGTWADGPLVVAPMDFSHFEVHATTDIDAVGGVTFDTLRGQIASARGGEVTIPATSAQAVYSWIIARSLAGKASAPSAVGLPVAGGRVAVAELDGPVGGDNGVAPNPPTGLGLTTFAVLDSRGNTVSTIRASWTAPTENTDASPLEDLARYDVQYRRTGAAAWQSTSTGDTTIDLPVALGLDYDVRVSAVDAHGDPSAWTATSTTMSAIDGTPPSTPNTPVVTSYYGALRIAYDGKTSTGGAPAVDTNRIDVEIASSATGPWAVVASLTPFAAGVAYATAPYLTDRYVRFVAYDHAGNASAPSAVWGPVQTVQVGPADIASLSVSQLTGGTGAFGMLSAEVTIAGRLGTALTGARREMNAIGFQAWDASNNLIINLDGVNNLLTGAFRTAASGRRIEMVTGATSGDINLMAADGKRGFVRSYLQGTGQEAVQIGMSITAGAIANVLWNRLTINSSTAGESASLRSGTLENIYDSSAPNNGSWRVFQTTARGESTSDIRAYINSEWNAFYHPISGSFRIYDRSDASGVERLRYYVFDTGTTQYIPVTGGYDIWFRNSDASTFRRFRVERDNTYFNWEAGTAGYLRFYEGASGTTRQSPKIAFVDASGTGAVLRAGWSSANGSRLEARNILDGGFEKMFALSFDVQSIRDVKRDIVDLTDQTVLDLAARTRVRDYLRISSMEGDPERREFGLVVDEAPKELVTPDKDGVSLYSLAALALATAQLALRTARGSAPR